ncbi:hypothetical protein LARI1_G005245, partial [Lachnellula arida]
AIQSDRIRVLIRVIELPHVKILTFEDFLFRIYTCEPSLDLDNLAPILNLAIFAEIYIICHLKNQTSDLLRTGLGNSQWQLTLDDISIVYDKVPPGKLFFRNTQVLVRIISSKYRLVINKPPGNGKLYAGSMIIVIYLAWDAKMSVNTYIFVAHYSRNGVSVEAQPVGSNVEEVAQPVAAEPKPIVEDLEAIPAEPESLAEDLEAVPAEPESLAEDLKAIPAEPESLAEDLDTVTVELR